MRKQDRINIVLDYLRDHALGRQASRARWAKQAWMPWTRARLRIEAEAYADMIREIDWVRDQEKQRRTQP